MIYDSLSNQNPNKCYFDFTNRPGLVASPFTTSGQETERVLQPLNPHGARSLKVIETITDRCVANDFLLTFHGKLATTGLYRTVSQINSDFSRKSQFSTPVYLTPC